MKTNKKSEATLKPAPKTTRLRDRLNRNVICFPSSRWMSTEIYRQMDGDWKLLHSHWTFVKK